MTETILKEAMGAIAARIDELLSRLSKFSPDASSERRPQHELAAFQECVAATVSIGTTVYGDGSVQMGELLKIVEGIRNINKSPGVMDGRIAVVLHGFLSNLKREIQAGLLIRLAEAAADEVLGDFIVLADRALTAGQKDVAAVLASAALEDLLKRKAAILGINADDQELAAIVSALKAKGVFHGAEPRIVSSFVGLRNRAMHAQWDKISGPDVASLLGYLKTSLSQNVRP